MHIEMLWIIPVMSFMVFIGIVFYFAQKKTLHSELKDEVNDFNSGASARNHLLKQPEIRLEDLEKAITAVTNSISNQQNTLNSFKKDTTDNSSEINDLKDKLRELYKEYDIVISENYSLRAKVKKMMEQKNTDEAADEVIPEVKRAQDEGSLDVSAVSGKVNLKLYEDTRLLNVTSLDDFDIPRPKAGTE